ncbi:MAG TPA: hypothetical protein VL371_22830 [Gemmataceae bacterium]|nr:hypothetical protein [Gemmataceae bacterium]
MLPRDLRYSRRKFLASAAAATLGSGLAHRPTDASVTSPPSHAGRAPIAVLATVYRPLSYAYHLVGRFLHGYPRGGEQHVPAQYVHSLWVEQAPENDLSRELARLFDFRRARTVRDALLDDQGRLAVEGVLIIGEHGNYPRNEKGQILYPRAELFEQVTDVFRQTGRSVPVFCAKHLSYSFDKAARLVAVADELGFPLLAGSTLPTTWRRPELELPRDAAVEEALVAAYGPIEVAGFDALEALQCMVERRRGGETGVRAVTCLSGPAVWQAADAGRWQWDLLQAALANSESVNLGDVRQNCGRVALPGMPATPPVAFLIEYADGTRGTVLLINGHLQDFVFAARLRGVDETPSCLFRLPPAPGAKHFDGQAAAIERLIAERRSPQPIGRTLLTTGMIDSLMESHHRRGERIETPHLTVRYEPPAESSFVRGSVV